MLTSKKAMKVEATALTIGVANKAMATTITLPEPLGEGVTLGDYVTVAITSMGAVVVVVVGGFFAFKIIKVGLGWAGRAIR